MIPKRVIPALLLKGVGLYKTQKFKQPKYIGDPINTVRIFNAKEVDEIALLDIEASGQGRGPNFDLIAEIISESFMPLAYGGGITTAQQAVTLFKIGVEKVILNTSAIDNPSLISKIAEIAGSQAVTVAIDVKKPLLGAAKVYAQGGTRKTEWDAVAYAKEAQKYGAGELFVTSVDREGTFSGYDLELIERIARSVDIPIIANGGAASINDFEQAFRAGASAVAAGAMFVYTGPHRAVLIQYPSPDELKNLTQHLQKA